MGVVITLLVWLTKSVFYEAIETCIELKGSSIGLKKFLSFYGELKAIYIGGQKATFMGTKKHYLWDQKATSLGTKKQLLWGQKGTSMGTKKHHL